MNVTTKLLPSLIFFVGAIHAAEFSYIVSPAYPNLFFQQPLYVNTIPDGSNRILVVEQVGRVCIFKSDPEEIHFDVALDITAKVRNQHLEEGLLGFAFHPGFNKNHLSYLFYSASNPRRSVIAEVKWDLLRKRINPESERILLEIDQPWGNHNGGSMAFGPNDGYLYISVGDGGSAGDPNGHAQNLNSHLGKILRIDVNNKGETLPYAIPESNPFINNSNAHPEIYALGLRNVWRFTFHPDNGEIWAGDVGQNSFEEIDIISKGGNYGWNLFEGTQIYKKKPRIVGPEPMIPPIYVYDRDQGQSVTGSVFYQGKRISELQKSYIYADFLSGRIWALKKNEDGKFVNRELTKGSHISSFGLDPKGEILFTSLYDGQIYTLNEIESK